MVGLRAVVQAAKDVVANVTGCPERECSATTSAWAGTNSAHRVSAPGTERRTQLRFEPVILSNPELGPVIRRYRNVGGKNVTATPTRQPSRQGHDHADGKRAPRRKTGTRFLQQSDVPGTIHPQTGAVRKFCRSESSTGDKAAGQMDQDLRRRPAGERSWKETSSAARA